MYVMFVDEKGRKTHYAKREDGYWYRWYDNDSRERWGIVPWYGY